MKFSTNRLRHKLIRKRREIQIKTSVIQLPYYVDALVLTFPLIGSLSSSTANERAVQTNCYMERTFGNPSICTTESFSYPYLIRSVG